ncbi:hypothetical protein DV515_00012561 [Chloebia gouldiae]|uniref:Uncharacterized protein n=1 Tax=Chloebia gouldiae TaxID=44316 RepID=A0A3L8S4I4_CHLGU|nr:hypothetical protein DV515_00012561 [Chloebia gouldiae]
MDLLGIDQEEGKEDNKDLKGLLASVYKVPIEHLLFSLAPYLDLILLAGILNGLKDSPGAAAAHFQPSHMAPHWELQSTKKEDLQLLFGRDARHPEEVGKKLKYVNTDATYTSATSTSSLRSSHPCLVPIRKRSTHNCGVHCVTGRERATERKCISKSQLSTKQEGNIQDQSLTEGL